MTILAKIGSQNYAVGLIWVAVDSDKQLRTEILAHNGKYSISRKCPDKTKQAGIVTEKITTNAIVAADMIASWQPKSSVIVLTEMTKEDGYLTFWGVACVNGKILPGSDIEIISLQEAVAWVRDLSSIYTFEVYASNEIAEMMPEIIVDSSIDWLAITRQHGKITIGSKSRSSVSSKSSFGSNLTVFTVIALLAAGVYYYGFYEPEVIPAQAEMSAADKQAIIDALANEERKLMMDALLADDFSVTRGYIDATMGYPLSAAGWHVKDVLISVAKHTATVNWDMDAAGFISQLLAVRPRAEIITSGENAGSNATEVIAFARITRENNYSLDSVPSKKSTDIFLIETSQKLQAALIITSNSAVQENVPEESTGLSFIPTYNKINFSISGINFGGLIMALDRLSGTQSVKPLSINMTIGEGMVSTWSIGGIAYVNNNKITQAH